MDSELVWIYLVLLAALIVIGVVMLARHLQKVRFQNLMRKYNDPQVVTNIMLKKVWQGMSQQQLIDSRGAPEERDQAVYKTKTKETWKYGRVGKNRYRERIYVENGTVVGWKG